MEVNLPGAILGNYGRQTDRPTLQLTDRPGHREVILPINNYSNRSYASVTQADQPTDGHEGMLHSDNNFILSF